MITNQKKKNIDPAETATTLVETPHTTQETSHALHGGISGLIVSAILHPLEVIKIGIIINPMHSEVIQKANFAESFMTVGRYIYKIEGFKGYFRGLAPELVRSSSGTSIYFSILHQLEKIFDQNGSKKDDQLSQFMASACARMASAYLTNPLGVVASRCQVPGFNVYKNMFDGIKKIIKYEGVPSFMKGSLASALKEGPFAGTYYVIYKLLKSSFTHIKNDSHYLFLSLASGMTAGLIATTVSHPFEIIRARLQIISRFDKNPDQTYNGIFDAFKKIYEHDGVNGYFRGLAPRLVRKPLANSLTFTLFELFHMNSSKRW
ncbi:hypothetical protein ABPG72_013966 [Tetrahymena utriculariae]